MFLFDSVLRFFSKDFLTIFWRMRMRPVFSNWCASLQEQCCDFSSFDWYKSTWVQGHVFVMLKRGLVRVPHRVPTRTLPCFPHDSTYTLWFHRKCVSSFGSRATFCLKLVDRQSISSGWVPELDHGTPWTANWWFPVDSPLNNALIRELVVQHLQWNQFCESWRLEWGDCSYHFISSSQKHPPLPFIRVPMTG